MARTRRKENDLLLFLCVFCGYCVFYAIFFSPIIFRGKLFLSDGQLGSFYSELTLWSDVWAGGWPAAADLSQMMFSPLRHLFRQLPLPYGFNIFIISSYVLMSTFMFGYVHTLTASRLAGVISGITLGLSGFMMAHLGHTSIIGGAAWVPLLLWALERLRQGYTPLWFCSGTFTVCVIILSGHPQIAVYSFLLSGAYVLCHGFGAKPGRRRYWMAVTGMFFIGLCLSSFQWIPTYELSRETFRSAFTYEAFTSLSLPISQLFMLVFPFIFGTAYPTIFSAGYFGAGSYTELAGFCGIFCLTLSALALLIRHDRLTLFWFFAGIASVLLALGGSLPWVAKVIFHVPVLNQFRVPGRHMFEYAFSVSVLAGLGTAALQSRDVDKKKIKVLAKGLIFLFAILILLGVIAYSRVAPQNDAPAALHFASFRIPPAIYVSAFWMVLSVFFLFLYAKGKIETKKEWFVALIVALELAGFGWFQEWRARDFSVKLFDRDTINYYNDQAQRSRFKIISNNNEWFSPEIRIYGIPTLNWYGPLMLRRYSEAIGVNTSGDLNPIGISDTHVGLDIFGAKYLFFSPPRQKYRNGLLTTDESLSLLIGNGCGSNTVDKQLILLPAPVVADRLSIVSALACSAGLVDGSPVAEFTLHGDDGKTEHYFLRAGTDTAEHAADHHDVAPQMRHRKARIFESTANKSPDGRDWDAHTYHTQFSFPRMKVRSIEINNVQKDALLIVHYLTLNESNTGSMYPVDPKQSFSPNRWRLVKSVNNLSVYENLHVLPAAWLVFEALPVPADLALAAIRTSQLPNGLTFNPSRQSLVEKRIFLDDVNGSRGTAEGKTIVSVHDDMKWELRTQSNSTGLLIIGQNYYPGWRAEVDGKPVDILRVNYTQQGIVVPRGEHTIILRFRPRSFFIGLAVSVCSLIALIIIVWITAFGNNRRLRFATG